MRVLSWQDAFQHDPILNAVSERIPGLAHKINAIFEIPLRHCLKFGEVFATSEKLEGLAAWVMGASADMTVWRLLRSGALIPGMKIGPKQALMMYAALRQREKDRREIMQGRAYRYLQIIGVATVYQGQGYGGMLLRALIEKSDGDGLPVYLETETERNVNMYKRFGFEVIKEIALPVIHLPMWEMVREPEHDQIWAV